MTERQDQPSKVSTEEEVRPTDEHVVTSDLPEQATTSDADQDAKPAASDDDKSDQTTKPSAGSDDKQKPQRGRDRSAERRIKKLTRQVADLEAARGSDQAEIERLKGEIQGMTRSQAKADPEPQFKDFDSPQEYAKAYGDWETRQAGASSSDTTGKRETTQARDPSAHAQHQVQPAPVDPDVRDFQQRGQEKLGDEFVEALETEGTAVDQNMGEFLMDSDYGPEIYVHLANNQDISRKIFDSGARRQMQMLEDLEAKAKKGELDIDAHDAAAPGGDDDQEDKGNKDKGEPGKQTDQQQGHQTRASEPPSDTRDGGAAPVAKDPEDESMDEYAARRKKEEMRKAGYNV